MARNNLLTEPALPSTKITHRPQKINLAKIWSQSFHEIELAVCRLPNHKVTQPLLSGGSDNQIQVGLTSGVKVGGDGLHTDVVSQ
jgi:hypothetical protein